MDDRRWKEVQAEMKVYQVKPMVSLVCQAKAQDFLSAEKFSGRPFPDDWRRVDLRFERGRGGKADFFGFASKALVCSERVRMFVGPLEDEGEFFPVRVKGLQGKYYLYNVTHCCSHLDPRRTTWRDTGAGPGARSIRSPAFHADRLGEDCVFKIPEDGATAIYCLERTGDPELGEFKALVKQHGFTGLAFKFVWRDC